MLERQDLEMIRVIMREEIAASEERSEMKMNARFAESEARMNARFVESEARTDARFAESDARFTSLEEQMDARFAESDARFASLEERMDARFASFEEQLDARFASTENLILGELDRVQIRLQDQIAQLNRKIGDMTEYYRIKKLDDVNSALLLKMIQEVEKRVEELEKKTA